MEERGILKKSETLREYLDREYGNIKDDPIYADSFRSSDLIMFDQDKLFHIRKSFKGCWAEWRILSYINLRLANTPKKVSEGLMNYLEQEFEAIKADPDYKASINDGRLKVFEQVELFHMDKNLDGSYNEWRILSYNAIRAHSLLVPSPSQT